MRGMRRLRSLVPVALVACALLAVVASCSVKKTLKPDAPPTTRLFVHYDANDGETHTVHHIAHLYWFGSDADGYVVGYDIRFIWPGGNPNPPWSRTTRTDSLFVIPDTTGLVNPVFQVRAVDDHGNVDPSPPQQEFSFSNAAPVVTLQFPPTLGTDTTFATQTIDWTGVDPDGDAGQLSYKIWLDGNEASPHVTSATEFTFPTTDFYTGGRLRYGPRTAYVQAVDPGGRPSTTVSASWYVRPTVPDTTRLRGKLLVIDDVHSTGFNGGAEPGDAAFDAFFNNAVFDTHIPTTSWTTVRLERGRMFRSTADLLQTFKLFDCVVWYRGQIPYGGPTGAFNANRDSLVRNHSQGIGDYVDGGGNFYMESLDLVGQGTTDGLFTVSFMQRYFASDFLYKNKPFGANDSTIAWSYGTNDPYGRPAYLHSSTTAFNDILHIINSANAARLFGVRDTNDVVLWAPDTTLSAQQRFVGPIAVRSVTGGGGKVVVSSIPMLVAGGPASGPGTGRNFIGKIFAYLGIVP